MCSKDVHQHFGHKFRMIDKYFEKRCDGSIHYLTRVQCATLYYLYDHPDEDVFQKDIEAEFSISGATATNILKGLERQALITREPMPEDARLKKIVLTEEGIDCNAQATQNMHHMEETLTAGFSEEELEEFRDMRHKIYKSLPKIILYIVSRVVTFNVLEDRQ